MSEGPRIVRKSLEKDSKTKYKVVFLGDVMVGKTTFIGKYLYGTASMKYQPTVGIDFLSANIQVDNRTIRLQLWDTAGQERFRSLIPSYIRDSTIAFVLYSVTDRSTFQNVASWIAKIRDEGNDKVIILVVANKIDVSPDERKVSTEEGEQLARELNVLYGEASAKTGDNVKALFLRAAFLIPNEPVSPGEIKVEAVTLEEKEPKIKPETQESSCSC